MSFFTAISMTGTIVTTASIAVIVSPWVVSCIWNRSECLSKTLFKLLKKRFYLNKISFFCFVLYFLYLLDHISYRSFCYDLNQKSHLPLKLPLCIYARIWLMIYSLILSCFALCLSTFCLIYVYIILCI